ncbi:deoxycytidine triphosphate deaminase [Neorhizobium huautlense]|uniref:Deoxycytidine triphosphate deaminase n=1 Tax=Neorhizobium huautlense TaxID=67774 RepID=A0ABT9PTB9_9HYPH|nr:hypothetical protein [Neorhizobium huautlense]MDP9837691.1 deoxycytidine triphosphate deaminase [Neorhizobium huautlense]
MMLTDREIREARLVSFDNDGRYSATSYDLSVDTIIDSTGITYRGEGYSVKPQEIVWVISRERIELPANITAHAVIKTSLCNSGLLALNIGIVDPGWQGPLATAIINFSSSTYYLKPKESFLRLSFFRHETPSKHKAYIIDANNYLEDKKKAAIETFGSTFLDIDGLAKKVSSNLIGGAKEKIFFWSAAAAILLGFLSVFIAVSTYLMPWSGPYQGHFDDLEKRVTVLEATSKKATAEERQVGAE